MSKICSVCNEDKPISEYKGRMAYCKSCYNQQRKRDRVNKKTIDESSEGLVMLLIKAKELTNFTEKCLKHGVDVPNIVELANKVMDAVQIVKNNGMMLRFGVSLSEEMSDYIEKASIHCKSLTQMKLFLHDRYINEFNARIALDRETIIKHVDELDLLGKLIDGIKIGYRVLAEDANAFNKDILGKDEPFTLPEIEFDPITKTIQVSRNPLNLSAPEFIHRVTELEHIGVKWYTTMKYWDKLIVL